MLRSLSKQIAALDIEVLNISLHKKVGSLSFFVTEDVCS